MNSINQKKFQIKLKSDINKTENISNQKRFKIKLKPNMDKVSQSTNKQTTIITENNMTYNVFILSRQNITKQINFIVYLINSYEFRHHYSKYRNLTVNMAMLPNENETEITVYHTIIGDTNVQTETYPYLIGNQLLNGDSDGV